MKQEQYFDIVNKTEYQLEQYYPIFKTVFNEIKTVLNIDDCLELALIIVDQPTIVDLNQQYRQKDYVADVLSFQLATDDDIDLLKITKVRTLGDIFICYEKAVQQTLEYQHSITRELAFLFTHGMLHILGYDHIEKKEEAIMFPLQEKILNNLKIYRAK